MILTLSELEGKTLDWMYERAAAGNYDGMKTDKQGQILIEINDDYHPGGWYFYKSPIHDEEDAVAVRHMIRVVVDAGPFVVPTDLCLPQFAHHQPEKVKPFQKLSDRLKHYADL